MVFKRTVGYLLSLTLFVGLLAVCATAQAVTPAPGFRVIGRSLPTNLPPGGEGVVILDVYNLGAAPSNAVTTITSTLPEGLTVKETELLTYNEGGEGGECEEATGLVVCKVNPPIGLGKVTQLRISVGVGASASGSALARVTVSGGGGLSSTSATVPLTFGSATADIGFSNMAVWMTNADGTPDTQAGSHPFDLTVAFAMNEVATANFKGKAGPGKEAPAGGQIRAIHVNAPPGIVGDPQAVPQCPRLMFDEGFTPECPLGSEIGENRSIIGGIELLVPVYNLVPPPGVAAEFGFNEGGVPVFLDFGVRTGGDNGITTHVDNLPQRQIVFDSTRIWGVPGDPNHNPERCAGLGCPSPAGLMPRPLVTMPTSCGAPPEFSAEEVGTWTQDNLTVPPAIFALQDQQGNPVGFTGCEALQPFKPEISIAPDTSYADTPAGLSVDVKMPQGLNPEGLQTPGLRNTTVVLPEGVAINPGQATGLVACQSSQESLGTEPDGEVNEKSASCPSASKVGTDEVSSPLLRDKLQGNVYILSSNPPNLQLLVTASADGVNLKLVGNVHLNEQTGQLTTTFENTPDLPFTDFKLNFSGGAQAALATPTACGTYQASADFTPWSSPFIGDQFDLNQFAISAGPGGSPCVWPLPFSPSMTAGATTDQAGGYTSFTMLLSRGDGQQRIRTLSFKTPEGLLGMIAKVPLCEEPQAAAGTCSSASQIGHTVVGAGPGPYPFYIPQAGSPPAPIYLTGPYEGAPFGLSIVVPIHAGPFDLGTEVVRGRIDVDPLTAQITVTTDPLPQIVKGVPADLRTINAVIDRPEFMFNPTDCAPMSFSGTATSVEGASAPLASHFQMGSCQSLKFKPNFTVSTSGRSSRATGASLHVKLVYPTGSLGANQASSQSNIRSVKVSLPRQLPSQLKTLQQACPDKTFNTNPAACGPASRIGTAKAITPVLPVPLTGPVYFVSHGGQKFPELVVVLSGYGVTVQLHSETFIDEKKGITSSTFRSIPDVPVGTFELTLPQGKYPALAAPSGHLCQQKLKMPTAFTAQNGAIIHQNTPITVTNCPKTKKHTKTKVGHRAKR
ncbi:MAG: hypothetical protein ACRDJ3_05925 [Solirubrobacteraceae bacterium]